MQIIPHEDTPMSPLPPCLQRKLVFGDSDQIAALREYEANFEKDEREWVVDIEISGSVAVKVFTASKAEAIKMVRAAYSVNDFIADVDVDYRARPASKGQHRREK